MSEFFGWFDKRIQFVKLAYSMSRCKRTMSLTLKAGLAPSSNRHLTADRHRLDAAMCRAVPKSKSLQVASTSTKKRYQTELLISSIFIHFMRCTFLTL